MSQRAASRRPGMDERTVRRCSLTCRASRRTSRSSAVSSRRRMPTTCCVTSCTRATSVCVSRLHVVASAAGHRSAGRLRVRRPARPGCVVVIPENPDSSASENAEAVPTSVRTAETSAVVCFVSVVFTNAGASVRPSVDPRRSADASDAGGVDREAFAFPRAVDQRAGDPGRLGATANVPDLVHPPVAEYRRAGDRAA